MSSDVSVTRLIGMLKQGDRVASQQLWEIYFGRLVGLARSRLKQTVRRVADEEDVALSALDSFFRRAENGQFPQLQDRDDLWQLLFVLTVRKAINLVHHQGRKSRGGGRVQSLQDLEALGAEPGLEHGAHAGAGSPVDRGMSEVARQARRRDPSIGRSLEDGGIYQHGNRRQAGMCRANRGTQASSITPALVKRGVAMSMDTGGARGPISHHREDRVGLRSLRGRLERGPRPRIEEYWREADGIQLLRELLVLDLVYRLRHHDHPNPAEYQARFPAHAGAIRSAFEAAGISVPSPEPLPPRVSFECRPKPSLRHPGLADGLRLA